MPLSDNDVALIFNAFKGNLNEVRALLLDGANVNAQDSDGATALHMASQNGHLDVVRALLKIDNVDVNLQSAGCPTALSAASQNGHLEVVLALLQHDKVDVNLQSAGGTTALYIASFQGHVKVVRALLQHDNVDVNRQCTSGATALHIASRNGYVEVVRALLQHDNVDVNLQLIDNGSTALYMASHQGHVDVVRELLQNSKVNANLKDNDELTALDVAHKHNKFAVIKAFHDHTKTLEEVNKNRESLAKVMTTCKAEPVELSYHYIKRCIKIREIGSGAYGNVFLFEDGYLPEPKKFALKMIKLSQTFDGPNKYLKSFQKELSTLKRFRHPNIIVLYGYNFKGSAGEQFLVYEYAAKGSLDVFLKDESKRADLPATLRLSIMYQVARAVHILHSGAVGFKVYHRDIKSANICLTEDFTPRLIDCGLAKFVEDEHNAFPSNTIEITGSNGSPAFGTHAYMCPEYWKKTLSGSKCAYIPAYDVYSIGVVMAELILGRLNDRKRTNVLQTYVQNDEGKPIDDGWEKLKDDADKKVTWNSEALEVVCLTAMGCLIRPSQGRLSTIELLDLLKHAITLNAMGKSTEQEVECEGPSPKMRRRTDDVRAMLNAILRKIGKGVDGDCCIPCSRRADLKCGEGHTLCVDCIEEAIMDAGANYDLRCLIDGCSSQPFTDKELCKHIRANVWIYLLNKKTEQRHKEAMELQKKTKEGVDEIKNEMKKLSSVIYRHLPGWALNNANAEQLKLCPTVVVITRIAADRSKDLKTWFTNTGKQKYQVVFYCERSDDPGHEPFEISVDRKWMVMVAPWLRIVVNIGAELDPSKVALAVLKEFPLFPKQTKEMKALIDELGKVENDGQIQTQTLQGGALEAIAKMANEKENLKKWRDEMEPVVGENGRTMWVKKRLAQDEGGHWC